MKKIPFYVESSNGHDTTLVPENKVIEEVVKQVEIGKWATLEKQDGSSEIITKSDIEPVEADTDPDIEDENATDEDEEELDEEDKELSAGWQGSKPTKPSPALVKKFEKVTSVTCTNKAKGG